VNLFRLDGGNDWSDTFEPTMCKRGTSQSPIDLVTKGANGKNPYKTVSSTEDEWTATFLDQTKPQAKPTVDQFNAGLTPPAFIPDR